MKYLIIILAIFFLKINAQNIIPDPGFEIFQSGEEIGNVANDMTDCEYDTDFFDDDMDWWKVAKHSNDKGEADPDLVKENYSTCYNEVYHYCSNTFAPNNIHALIQAIIFKENQCDNTSGDDNPDKFHEAVRIGFNGASLTNGTTYILRYKIKAVRASVSNSSYNGMNPNCHTETDFCHLRIFFAKLGEDWNHTINNDQFEATSANVQRTYNEYNCYWEYIERTITVPSSGSYKNLIFYAESGGFAIDDVELFPQCTDNYYIQNKKYIAEMAIEGGGIYKEKVSNQIFAGNNIGAYNVPTGDVIIPNNATVIYTAGNEISLKNGFSAELGSEFTAVIDGCPNSRSLNANSDTNIGYLNNNDYLTKNISIFPNPNRGEFTISIQSSFANNTSIYIVDLSGRILHTQSISLEEGLTEIPVIKTDLPGGIYFIKVDGIDEPVKMIITK